ncbi:hypothetical protein [Pseudosporangium ferrugineum]|uniref:DUF998 domain-containing protein n=1 Tax=Pseudosporangium ferrugineum TaxID=439699 RepID=A0A2T0SG52_9ACTN|nr:hypothetical protein [Pseudosporangium ferrugineum]PRY32385.1 hypothetical protein CLV70_102596 [Pseudosporangium ferrugineum]
MNDARYGLWTAVATVTACTATAATAVTTPPRSGPYCRSGCIGYPYTEAAAFVPRDYVWMYPALLTALLFVVLAVCLHGRAAPGRRVLTGAGVGFAVTGAATLVADYAVQLTVMQPSLLSGETAGLSPLSQYNPHGVFIALENVGYATVGLALVFLGGGLAGHGSRPIRAAGAVFAAGGALTTAVLVLYGAIYRARLDYRFEVVSMLITWIALIAGGLLLVVAFARAPRSPETGT